MATSGPGATNLVTPIADAYMDSVPIVAITGQVSSTAIGTDAFQEADIRGITMPITKHNYLVTDPAEIPRAIAEAFHIASTGRPGPVLVDIGKDALQARRRSPGRTQIDLPGYRPVTKPHAKQIREAARLIADVPTARCSTSVAASSGRGASDELRHLAELTGIPVVTTLMARGALPDSHPQNLGMPGMHGTVARGDGAAEGRPDRHARRPVRRPGHRPAVDASRRTPRSSTPTSTRPRSPRTAPPTCRSSATLKEVIARPAARCWPTSTSRASRTDRLVGDQLEEWRATYPLGYDRTARRHSSPAVRHRAHRASRPGPEAIYVAGVGQHQMWAAQFIQYERPNTWLNSGGLGHHGLRGAGGHGRQGRASRTAPCGRSTATAASR